MRWIAVNKDDKEIPLYRSGLVARELYTHKREDLFAVAPQLEALNVTLPMTRKSNNGEMIVINVVSRAFFHAKANRQVFVQFAKEDTEAGQEHMCGRLKYNMYVTRDAAQNLYDEYSQQLTNVGFTQGVATPCVFYHKEMGVGTVVHGDGYVSIGKLSSLKWMKESVEKNYQL